MALGERREGVVLGGRRGDAQRVGRHLREQRIERVGVPGEQHIRASHDHGCEDVELELGAAHERQGIAKRRGDHRRCGVRKQSRPARAARERRQHPGHEFRRLDAQSRVGEHHQHLHPGRSRLHARERRRQGSDDGPGVEGAHVQHGLGAGRSGQVERRQGHGLHGLRNGAAIAASVSFPNPER